MIGFSVQGYTAKASEAYQRGDSVGALAVLAQALKTYPKEPSLWHHTGGLMLQSGNGEGASEHFGQAFALAPAEFDFAIDQAIALTTLEKYHDALRILAGIEKKARRHAHYWSTRANAARGAGDRDNAARWYNRALSIEPTRPKALSGRASVALERGEPDAVKRFEKALTVQSDPQLWLGKAQALDVEGRSAEARDIAEGLVKQFPHWIEGLKFLAQLNLGEGVESFDAPFHMAAERLPDDPNIPREHCRQLGALGVAEEAADIAAKARKRFPDDPYFAMLEAMQAGIAGQDARAEAIWATLEYDHATRHSLEATHWVRQKDFSRADNVLNKAFALQPWNIDAWALRDIIWRKTADARHDWLHGQEGLVQFLPLHNVDRVLPKAMKVLNKIHDTSRHPLGQSLRKGGTQTRGRLFDRYEPELTALHKAILATLETYRNALPPADETHPLLRHRDADWTLFGSWSVRFLIGSAHHAPHLHPEGLLSSACYLILPDDLGAGGNSKEGWLELGQASPDMRLDLPSLHELKPQVGHLALFPSTLYHGTRPFNIGKRMTVAFDVQVP